MSKPRPVWISATIYALVCVGITGAMIGGAMLWVWALAYNMRPY